VEIWTLKVELNGEWEECSFPSRREALATFSALAVDYHSGLARALLYASHRTDCSDPAPCLTLN
jgi:hypothetical protein